MKPIKQRIKSNKIYRAAEAFFLGNAPYTTINAFRAEAKKGGAMPSSVVSHSATILRVEDLASWKMAVMMATDPENPNKENLKALYDNMKLDNHLGSVVETRIAKTQQTPFRLMEKNGGDRNEEAETLLKTLWFQDFIKLVLESRFEGTKLIEAFNLNAEGYLTEVTEISQANFNAVKGIIQKEPGDQAGIPYKTGSLAAYYIQVGRDYRDLGTFALIAPIVLAKKLGIGSWLDFIEKYGIPPLFVTSEREDDDRLMELFEMATNFKANNFMIGRGNEKFEIPNISTSNSQEAFDGLIKRADNEISKRFLGGTGLTDEKGFVGSVEIQFELAQFRFASDRLMVASIVNEKLLPLMAAISPAYSLFANLRFEWDDDEEMTVEKLCDTIQKLGSYFDFDPEQVEQITGLRILGLRSAATPEPGAEAPKKKAVT